MHVLKYKKLKMIGCAVLGFMVAIMLLLAPVSADSTCTGNGAADPAVQCASPQPGCPGYPGAVSPFPASCNIDQTGNPLSASEDLSSAVPQGDQLDAKCSGTNVSDGIACSKIFTGFIDPLIKFLAIGVGVIVVIVIIIGGIQYATSAGNPQATAAARKRIFGAILALVVFALLYALLNWVVPGGLPTP